MASGEQEIGSGREWGVGKLEVNGSRRKSQVNVSRK